MNPTNTVTDDAIIELYWSRDESAIEQTDQKYGKHLYRTAYNILGDALDSEECQNDTYLAAWNAIPPQRPRMLPAFLTQIIRRIAIDRYREKQRQKRIPSELTISMEDLHESLQEDPAVHMQEEAEHLGHLLSDFLRKLPEREQHIFLRRYYFADPIDDIAHTLGVSESTVYKQLTKLKKALKSYLEKEGVSI